MVQVKRYADLIETPWKNGGGTMWEIARGGPDPWSPWQMGRASVIQNSSFSRFDGLVRILTVVEGKGLTLLVDDMRLDAMPLDPICFDGGAQTEARLHDGPVSPFNLIFDPRFCHGRVEALHGPIDRQMTGTALRIFAVHAVSGVIRAGQEVLDPNDTAIWGPSPDAFVLEDRATALLISLEMKE